MADTKITALTAITTVDPAADVLPIVDVSDTSMAASGTTKKITSNQILGAGGTATLASATITGDLTVDTSTLKVDSANNRVGIVTASPNNTLTVRGTQDAGIEVNSADSNSSRLITAYDPANTRWYINSTLSGSGTTLPLAFLIQNSEVARFNTTGNLAFANGKGIDFSATTSGSGTMTSELLNDYEEGTWTIGLAFGGASTGITASANQGKYTKIGRQVTVTGYLGLTNKGSATGDALLTGLPFLVQNSTENYSAASLHITSITFADFPMAYGSIGTANITLQEVTNAGVRSNLTDADFSNNSEILLSFTYFV